MSICYENIDEKPCKRNVGICPKCGASTHQHKGTETEEYQRVYFKVDICAECGWESPNYSFY